MSIGENARGDARFRIASWVIAVLAAGFILPFARAHIHDWDASVYTIVTRHLARDLTPWRLSFLPHRWPEFYEHPPLFFILNAVLWRTLGERALPWAMGAVGIATVISTFAFVARRVSLRAGVAAALVLMSTESFFRYQARVKLDPWLTLFMTGAILLMVGAFPREQRTRHGRLITGGLLAGLAILGKGPPPLACPVVAAIWVALETGQARRGLRCLLFGGALALLLPALCVAADVAWLDRAWSRGYLGAQVLASLDGSRGDPWFSRTRMLQEVAWRFWPGLPLALIGALAPLRDGSMRRLRLGLVVWSLAIIAGFSLPSRGYWWYIMPAFVPLAMLAGVGLERGLALLPRLEAAPAARWKARIAATPLQRWPHAATLLASVSIAIAWPRWIMPPCVLGSLPEAADLLQTEGSIALYSEPLDSDPFHAMASSHVEADVRVMLPSDADPPDVSVALIHTSAWPRAGWRVVSAHGDWRLGLREAQRSPP